jgi:molecular chaperone GrpE
MTKEIQGADDFECFADTGLGADSPALEEPSDAPTPEGAVAPQPSEADFEDRRRRLQKEMDEREIKTRETMLLDFLEVADNLGRATDAWRDGGSKSLRSVQDGIEAVLRLFQSKLDRYGVTAIEAEGKPFDPHVHHAVSQSTSTDTTPGTVLQEVQKGYWMNGRLLRPAAVVVASAPAMASELDASDREDGSEVEPADEWHGYQRNRR